MTIKKDVARESVNKIMYEKTVNIKHNNTYNKNPFTISHSVQFLCASNGKREKCATRYCALFGPMIYGRRDGKKY